MTTRAAIYLRISLDAAMDGLAIDRQRQDCEALAEQRGWDVVHTYVDQSISASKKDVDRPDYDAMVASFERGEIDAIICWDLDRLTRQPWQLEEWIDRAEEQGLKLVTANGDADLATDGGRMYARIKAAVARGEIERKSMRQSRAQQQRAEQGRWYSGGVRPIGYTSTGEIIPSEAAAVLGMFRAVERGNSMRDIARALSGVDQPGLPDIPTTPRHMYTVVTERNARRRAEGQEEKPVPDAQPWAYTSLRSILRNPVYAGYSTYKKAKRKGVKNKYRRVTHIVRDPDTGEPVKGQWEPIVTPDLWWRVQNVLDDPDRLTNKERRNTRRHLGSGLYVCDECGNPVRTHADRYRCAACGLVRTHSVDDFVLAVIRARLGRDDLADLLPTVDDDEVNAIDDELAELRAKLARVQADYDEELIEARDLKRARNRYEPQIEKLETRRARLAGASALLDTTGYASPVDAFDNAELAVQRRVINSLCQVRLRRGVRGTKTFNPESVQIVWN
ncbi:recombinase family protein [Corynebacterium sp. P4_F2]|uniref:recombinase family protein n=1 Tax=Corynebacterium sp. P4_F2 TaxID=3059677 RepID=UPI0026561621|nr:recombinase family protein [Corynebacterium sp. P4_F2]MDN8595607.1 recombinase family protein [Corynebacterium sp. P4_F2]